MGTDERIKVVRIAEICGGSPRIEGQLFASKEIVGPAVLALGSVRFEGFLGIDTRSERAVVAWDEFEKSRLHGVIALKDVIFRDCIFRNVGFIGSQAAVDRLRRAIDAGSGVIDIEASAEAAHED